MVITFKISEFAHTHEREQANNLINALQMAYGDSEELVVLYLNINFNGVDIDAMVVKNDAIIVVEFKNYGGVVTACENGNWTLEDGTIVKGGFGGKNPFEQVKNNKWNVANMMKDWFFRKNANTTKTMVLVLFNKRITVSDNSVLSPSVRSWLKIGDMSDVARIIGEMTSPKINYTNRDLLDMVKALNCMECQIGGPKVSDILGEMETEEEGSLLERIKKSLVRLGFNIKHTITKWAREMRMYDGPENWGNEVREYLKEKSHGKLWYHQGIALCKAIEGKNVCVSTSTSSGKTRIFQLAAMDIIDKDPEAKILVVYPLKALGRQQTTSWNKLGHGIRCGRIDGDINCETKVAQLMENNVVCITPDTIHSFILGQLKNTKYSAQITDFMKHMKLVVVDEIHLYKGVFGSNSAYLFRRLNALVYLLAERVPSYITLSATINSPKQHSETIVGLPFDIVDSSVDGSPSLETEIVMVEETDKSQVEKLVMDIADNISEAKTITFSNSRAGVNFADPSKGVFPYKSGIESVDAEKIMKAMEKGEFRGVVSTSCLEAGINIAGQNVAILKDMPLTSTSFYQRIGRVGRFNGNMTEKSVVIPIHDPTNIKSQEIFENPGRIFSLPYENPALYLGNKNLMSIQAAHFVGLGMELDSVAGIGSFAKVKQFFPAEFVKVCEDVINNQYPDEYAQIATIDNPQFVFSLRSFEPNYDVVDNDPRCSKTYGTLTESQMVREAINGTIFKYMGKAFRVKRVDRSLAGHKVYVQQDNKLKYASTEVKSVTRVVPQRASKLNDVCKYGDLKLTNMEVLEYTNVLGYIEKMRGKEKVVNYQDKRAIVDGIEMPSRNEKMRQVMTTGVVFAAPYLDLPGVNLTNIATMLRDCFMVNNAIDRNDVNSGAGRMIFDINGTPAGSSFFVINDSHAGGLNIAQCLMDRATLLNALRTLIDVVDKNNVTLCFAYVKNFNKPTEEAIRKMYDDVLNAPMVQNVPCSIGRVSVVARGSKAMLDKRDADGNVVSSEPVGVTDVDEVNGKWVYEVEMANGSILNCDLDDSMMYVKPIPGMSRKAYIENNQYVKTTEMF